MTKTARRAMNLTVTVTGRTSWCDETYKTVGRFRGRTEMLVAVRDEKGKPAMKARRYITVRIVCSDGAVYRFEHDASMRYDAYDRRYGNPSAQVILHGCTHLVRYSELPPFILAEHARVQRRLAVIVRYCKTAIVALPSFKPVRSAR